MIRLTNDEIMTEEEYIERLEQRLDETEKTIEELKEIIKKLLTIK